MAQVWFLSGGGSEMARYAIIEDDCVINLVEATAKFAKSQGWVACSQGDIGWTWDGEQFLPPEPEPEHIPVVVSMRQARLALLGADLLDSVETAIAAMTDAVGKAAQIEWEYASEVRRDSQIVAALAQALQLDEETLDQLFLEAAKQ